MSAIDRRTFEEKAFEDPYGFMDSEDLSFVADTFEIIPVDAVDNSNGANPDMSWRESHIGSGGILTITDYGRHRNDCETLADFVDMVREKIRNDMGRQYLKVMDDDKSKVADTLVAISRKNGYVVLPYFEGE